MGLTAFNRMRRREQQRQHELTAKGASDIQEQPVAMPASGEVPEAVSLERTMDMLDLDPDEVDEKGFPYHYGGGMYMLSDGDTVKGKADAKKAQKRLDNTGA